MAALQSQLAAAQQQQQQAETENTHPHSNGFATPAKPSGTGTATAGKGPHHPPVPRSATLARLASKLQQSSALHFNGTASLPPTGKQQQAQKHHHPQQQHPHNYPALPATPAVLAEPDALTLLQLEPDLIPEAGATYSQAKATFSAIKERHAAEVLAASQHAAPIPDENMALQLSDSHLQRVAAVLADAASAVAAANEAMGASSNGYGFGVAPGADPGSENVPNLSTAEDAVSAIQVGHVQGANHQCITSKLSLQARVAALAEQLRNVMAALANVDAQVLTVRQRRPPHFHRNVSPYAACRSMGGGTVSRVYESSQPEPTRSSFGCEPFADCFNKCSIN
jgi:hypothetical protein